MINRKHYNGYLRKNNKNIFPSGDKKGILKITGFDHHNYIAGDNNDRDPTHYTIKLYEDYIADNFTGTLGWKWFGLQQPSTVDDYYNGWKIIIFINNKQYVSTIKKYYGTGNVENEVSERIYEIILDDIRSPYI